MPTVQGAMGPLVQRVRAIPIEAVFWTTALIAAASINPQATGGINLCLIEHLGLPCPGDGLGTAIAHMVRGHWSASWNAHPLGGPVVGVLGVHVVSLCRTAVSSRR